MSTWLLSMLQSSSTEAFFARFVVSQFVYLPVAEFQSDGVLVSPYISDLISASLLWRVSLSGSSVTTARSNCKHFFKRIHTWRMHKSTWLFQEYLIRLSLSQGELHYIPHAAATPLKTWRPKLWWKSSWTKTDMNILSHCWWFWGQTELGWACCRSLPIFTCRTCFMLASVFFFFLFYFTSSRYCLRIIYPHLYIREEEKKSSLLTCRFAKVSGARK